MSKNTRAGLGSGKWRGGGGGGVMGMDGGQIQGHCFLLGISYR